MRDKNPVLVLHGISEGKESEFIQKIVAKAGQENAPVLAINFPYMERGETTASAGLQEEVRAITKAIDDLSDKYSGQIHIIAKSLGGIAASFYLEQTNDPRVKKLTILGAVLEDLKLQGLNGYKVDVIQGQNDRFGSAQEVKQAFDRAGVPLHSLVEIENADHSYRDGNRQPVHQDKALSRIEI